MLVKSGVRIILVVCCLLGVVKGSCLSYGHSCWGGHGKRSVMPPINPLSKDARITLLQIILDKVIKNSKYNLKIAPGDAQKQDIFKPSRDPDFIYPQSSEEERIEPVLKETPTKRTYSNYLNRIPNNINFDDAANDANSIDDNIDPRMFKFINSKF